MSRSDGHERRKLALVRSVPRVMGFIGGTSDRPAPIDQRQEVDAIMNRVRSRLAISRVRKRCLKPVKWFALTTVRSLTLTAWWKKRTMRSPA